MTTATLHDKAARSLERWIGMVNAGDLSGVHSIISPDAVFRSPMSIHAYESKAAVMLALESVSKVFGGFAYHRQAIGTDGCSVVLEFSASIGGRQLKGIDFVRFGDDGLIVDFEVMLRPFNALQALGEAMGQQVGNRMTAYKRPHDAAVAGT